VLCVAACLIDMSWSAEWSKPGELELAATTHDRIVGSTHEGGRHACRSDLPLLLPAVARVDQ
jgi:hypothetical protein